MKTTGAHVFNDTQLDMFETWLKKHTTVPQMVTGETLNEVMQITQLNWGIRGRRVRARYINRVLFRVSQEGIFIIKELQ